MRSLLSLPVPVSLALLFGCAATAQSAGTANLPADRGGEARPAESAGVAQGMVLVPAGKAVIGMDEDEAKKLRHRENENYLRYLAGSTPRHEVQVEPFYLDRFECTNRQWKVYLDSTGRKPGKELLQYWVDGKIPEGHDNHPIVYIAYDEVVDYCRWAHKRLPTEIEWEYAARGREGFAYPWGHEFDTGKLKGGERAVCDTTKGKREARPVGSMPEGTSPFGIHDLAGNVWEWTSSRYTAYPNAKPIKIVTKLAPKGAILAGNYDRDMRVVRGGSFNRDEVALHAALRQDCGPKAWFNDIGFRTARSVQLGRDALDNALPLLASYNAKDELDLGAIVAQESLFHDATGAQIGARAVAFAPAMKLPRLKDMKEPSQHATLGVWLTTETTMDPPLPPGAYTVKYHPADAKAKPLYPPDDLWVHHESHHLESARKLAQKELAEAQKKAAEEEKKLREEAKKKEKQKKKGGKADGTEDEKPEGEPAPDAPAAPADKEGDAEGEAEAEDEGGPPAPPVLPGTSIQFDRSRPHIVLWSNRGNAVAALPIPEPKDTAKAAKPSLERKAIKPDVVKKVPALDRFVYSFAIETAQKGKAIAFELPIAFKAGTLEAPFLPAQMAAARPASAEPVEPADAEAAKSE